MASGDKFWLNVGPKQQLAFRDYLPGRDNGISVAVTQLNEDMRTKPITGPYPQLSRHKGHCRVVSGSLRESQVPEPHQKVPGTGPSRPDSFSPEDVARMGVCITTPRLTSVQLWGGGILILCPLEPLGVLLVEDRFPG